MPAIVSNKTSCTRDIVTNPFCLIVLQILLAVHKFLRTNKDMKDYMKMRCVNCEICYTGR